MIASLNHSPSSPSCETGLSLSACETALMAGRMFTTQTSKTAEQQCRVVIGIQAKAHAAPLQGVAFAGGQIFDSRYLAARVGGTDLDIAEVEPELARLGFRQ